MILVADASALVALAVCDSLSLLDALFGAVLVPKEVFDEVVIDCKPQSEYLLIDDKRGRKVAKINQIVTVGSMGVLLQAKRAGLIPAVAPLLVQIAASPVFMSPALIQTVVELAGEG